MLELKIIDEIIPEPIGGAHRDRDKILSQVKKSISRSLGEFTTMSRQDIIEHRKNKFLNIGRGKGLSTGTLSSDKLFSNGVNKIFYVKNKIWTKNRFIISVIFIIGVMFLSLFYLG